MKSVLIHPLRIGSCVFTLLAFIWLTTGSAFSYLTTTEQPISHFASHKGLPAPQDQDDTANTPFDNPGEEKTETGFNGFSAEYLQEKSTEHSIPPGILIQRHIFDNTRAFLNFCGESTGEPPEPFSC
jgi:hypothetical protein